MQTGLHSGALRALPSHLVAARTIHSPQLGTLYFLPSWRLRRGLYDIHVRFVYIICMHVRIYIRLTLLYTYIYMYIYIYGSIDFHKKELAASELVYITH